MERVLDAIRMALPFAEIAYATALLVNPAVAAEIRKGIEAFKRALEVEAGQTLVAKGYDGIDAKGKEVIAALNTLKGSSLSVEEKKRQGAELAAILSDPTKVHQARKGKDAELLQTYKLKASGIVASIV